MGIKQALLISFAGHCLVLAPVGHLEMLLSPPKKPNNIEVIYCSVKKPVPAAAEPIKVSAVQQPAKSTPQAQSEMKKAAPSAAKKRPARKRLARPVPEPVKAAPKKTDIEPASIPGTTLPNTPECITYYGSIREAIRRWLEREYRSDYGEGDIQVSFAINRSGKLTDLSVLEANSADIPILRRIARDSIQFASPFDPFPPNLKQARISFSLTIAFKRK